MLSSRALLLSKTRAATNAVRHAASVPAVKASAGGDLIEQHSHRYDDMVPSGEVTIQEQPERDLVNFPRPVMPLYPGRVRLGFVPDEWFDFFYKKTGVSGPYVFGVGLVTTLLSKELWVVEHEFPLILPMIGLAWYGITKFGPGMASALDKQIDQDEEELVQFQESRVQSLRSAIKAEEVAQWQAKGQSVLFEAKRENVRLQLEAEYRRRLMDVYNAVKKRLDYQVEIQNARRSVEKKHMVDWIVNNVVRSLDDKQEKENLDRCISNLKNMSIA